MTRSRLLTILLSAGLFLAVLTFIDTARTSVNLPGNHQGYEPAQPISYSHRLHAGELGIDCRYCHFGAERSRSAGVPPTNVCMNCHGFISAPFAAVRAESDAAVKEARSPRRIIAPTLRPLYTSAGWNNDLKPDPAMNAAPIEWVRVHNLPDFVYFDHRPHVNAGVQCQQCHGEVQTMERVRQVEDLSMGWCVNCHRESNAIGVGGRNVHAPVDCVACHY